MTTRRLAILLLSLCGVAGCQGRDRANPLDPLNPDTGGVPDNLNAVAADGEVALAWSDLGLDDLRGFDLLRTIPGSADTVRLGGATLPPDETAWTDREVENGQTYAYRLRFLALDGSLSVSRADSATPGPAAAWVVDQGTASLRRISPDARDIVQSVRGLAGPRDLALSADGNDIWVADFFGGRVLRFDGGGEERLSVDLFSTGRGLPLTVGLDAGDRSAWVGSRIGDGSDVVVHLAEDGSELGRDTGIANPVSLDVDPGDGTVWVAALDGDAVFRRGPGEEAFTRFGGFDRPGWVAAEPVGGGCWVADDRGVTRLDREGRSILLLDGFRSARALAVDPADGACWAAHFLPSGTWGVSRIDLSGAIQGGPSGFPFVGGIAVNGDDGAAWLTSTGVEEGEVLRLSREGSILGRVGRLSAPSAIGVSPQAPPPPPGPGRPPQ